MTIIFIVISLIILSQWRQMILVNSERTVESVTQAFSVFVIETFIFAEKNNIRLDDALEYYIRDYMEREDRLRYVAIYDNNGEIIVHSDQQRFVDHRRDSLTAVILSSGIPLNRATDDERYGWVLESAYPLKIAGKSWGVLMIGFEGESLRRELKDLFFLIGIYAALATLAALTILFFMSGYLTSSMRKFVSAIDQFEIDAPMKIDKPRYDDEIATLYTHFNRMQGRLKESQNKVMEIQKQVYHAEKLASIGRLASGVAHEINNPLNGIRSCLFRLEKGKSAKDQKNEYLGLINEAVGRIEKIVKKLLGFARREKQVLEQVHINEEITKVIALMDYKLTQSNTRIKTDLDASIPNITGDPQLLNEVFMNILINAFDAVEQDGIIEISTAAAEDRSVSIVFKDNGSGINEEDMEQIFDPFFTTKDPGKGTGLGLAVAQNIVETHNGTIRVESSRGNGTTVTIILRSVSE